jgi:hypothetical protein
MHERGQSDSPIVLSRSPNNAAQAVAEAAEGSGLAKGNATSKTRPGFNAGVSVPSALDRVRRVAQQDRGARFVSLLHHVDVDRLRAAYWALKPKAAPGVDGVTWGDYGEDLEANLQDLHSRVHRGSYRARPSRRVYIPKPDGRQRPLGIAALEDKLLQRAVVEVLNAIYGKRRTTGMRKGMKESYVEDIASHGGPGHALAAREGAAKRWIQGARRPAIEPRNAFDWGADAVVFSEGNTAGGVIASRQRAPRGLRTRHACDLFMPRTGRSHGHPPVVMVGRVVRGRSRP